MHSPVKEKTNAKELTPYKSLDEMLEKLSVDDNHEQTKGTYYMSSGNTGLGIQPISKEIFMGDYFYSVEYKSKENGNTYFLNLYKIEEGKYALIKSPFSVSNEMGTKRDTAILTS